MVDQKKNVNFPLKGAAVLWIGVSENIRKTLVQAEPLTQVLSCLVFLFFVPCIFVFPTKWLNLHLHLVSMRESVHPWHNSNRGWTYWIIESIEIEGHDVPLLWKDEWSYFCGAHLQQTQTSTQTDWPTQTHTDTRTWLPSYLWYVNTYVCTHVCRPRYIKGFTEEPGTLRFPPYTSPFTSVKYLLLIFALCTVDNICESVMGCWT